MFQFLGLEASCSVAQLDAAVSSGACCLLWVGIGRHTLGRWGEGPRFCDSTLCLKMPLAKTQLLLYLSVICLCPGFCPHIRATSCWIYWSLRQKCFRHKEWISPPNFLLSLHTAVSSRLCLQHWSLQLFLSFFLAYQICPSSDALMYRFLRRGCVLGWVFSVGLHLFSLL